MPLSFTILTPSFNQLDYLKRCVASVRDQFLSGVHVRHIVVDGASSDGTPEWLAAEGIEHISAPDQGMYDALNKGLDLLAQENLLNANHCFAWLNADEQYLPNALRHVAEHMAAQPEVDILCGDALVVDPNGQLLTYWKSLPLRLSYLRIGTLYNLTCAMFFRSHLFHGGTRFQRDLKAVADVLLVQELVKAGARSDCVSAYLSSYTYAPSNISNQPLARTEYEELKKMTSSPHRVMARVARCVERQLRGTRRQTFPLEYALYMQDLSSRTRFVSKHASATWPRS